MFIFWKGGSRYYPKTLATGVPAGGPNGPTEGRPPILAAPIERLPSIPRGAEGTRGRQIPAVGCWPVKVVGGSHAECLLGRRHMHHSNKAHTAQQEAHNLTAHQHAWSTILSLCSEKKLVCFFLRKKRNLGNLSFFCSWMKLMICKISISVANQYMFSYM